MSKRLLALLAAVAMVVVAVAVRARIDNGGGGDASTALHLVCATELSDVCDAIHTKGVDVTIEPATVTADRLRSVDADKADIDGWLAPGPWGAIVDAARAPSAGDLFAAKGEVLARSPFVVAVWKDRRARLACPDPVAFACVGDAVISRGIRLGMAADNEAEGVLADAALGAGHIKNPHFATNDLDETDLADWIAAVDTNADQVGRNPGGRSFTELLTFGEAAADGYLSTEADIGPVLAGAVKRGQLDVAYPSPIVTADVEFFGRPGNRSNRLSAIVRGRATSTSLRDHGWRVVGLPNIPGVADTPRLPDDDGLPSAGVLEALRDVTK
jgi:hypothetical protein